MAPMRWHGGDRAPSRKSSLLCLLISNWPELLTGTGILELTHTDRTTERSNPVEKKNKKNNPKQPKIVYFLPCAIKAESSS